jgi:hypothetical protein
VGPVKEGDFSDEEVAAAIALHPHLTRIGPGTIVGELEVYALYEGEEIRDRFRVRITQWNPLSDRVPALYEIGGRTNAIVAKWSLKDPRDVHCNLQGNACICVKQEEFEKFPLGADLPYFIEHLVRDYLYGLALPAWPVALGRAEPRCSGYPRVLRRRKGASDAGEHRGDPPSAQ